MEAPRESRAWFEFLSELRARSAPCVVVVVTGVRGSAPREVGARMIVAEDQLAWGTIGGGNLEHMAIAHATQMLERSSARSESHEYTLSEQVGQCCGGQVTLFYEAFLWRRRRIVIFGAGHVGQALGGLASYLGAQIQIIDPRSRGELQPPLPENPAYEVLFIDSPEEEIDNIEEDSLVLIMTHNHGLDLEILERALKRGTFPYLGLIGSERKWLRFKKRLEQRGFSSQQIASVRCPIGAARTSKEPTAIAISTAAELLEVMAQLSAEAGA